MELSEARIYVDSLSDYNEGNAKGKWIDLSDHSSGDEVMTAIQEFLDELNEADGGSREEYAIHDYEGFPKSFYGESMGTEYFDEIYAVFEVAEDMGIPVDSIEIFMNNAGSGAYIKDVEDAWQG